MLGVSVPGSAERYLCDVGVGNGSPIEPIRLVEYEEQLQGADIYRMVKRGFLGWVLGGAKARRVAPDILVRRAASTAGGLCGVVVLLRAVARFAVPLGRDGGDPHARRAAHAGRNGI